MADNGFPVTSSSSQENANALAPVESSEHQSGSNDLVVSSEPNDQFSPVETGPSSVDEKSTGIKSFFKDGEMIHRLILLGFLVIFIAGIIFAVFSFTGSSNTPDTQRRLGQYSSQDIGPVIEFLKTEGYKYKLSNNTVIVDANEYDEIKEKMLIQGIAVPKENTDDGDKIIMTDSGFGVSQRMESERIKHGREVQLARAIERIDGVQRATVLLAVPKENVFAREKSRPSAAVVVTLKPNAYLTPENVNSIRFIVSSSVHNLLSKDVTVTDQTGRQLSAEVAKDTTESKLQREFEMRTMREAQYTKHQKSLRNWN